MAAPAAVRAQPSPTPLLQQNERQTSQENDADGKGDEADDYVNRLSSPPLTQLLNDLSLKNSASAVVYRVVLTGGPCGGKTTAMGTLTERFQALGWRVFRVPEAATMLLSGGHSFANLNRLQQYQFQAALLKLMLSLEDAFIALARSTHERCIVLCDRGTMDCRSYMPEDEWEQLVNELGTSTIELRDNRYDCVVHLVTAADGADAFYTTEGHAARSEPPAYARELDLKVKNNWVGHPYFHVIDNSTNFNGKIRRVMSTICKFVGLQGNVGMSKRKFLVKGEKLERQVDKSGKMRIKFPDVIRYQKFEVQHDYILRPDQDQSHQLRLRRRGLNGVYTYSYTLRYPDLHGQRVELKRLINRREYSDLLLQRDPKTQAVSKVRYSFLYNDTYWELDEFISPHKGLVLLELYAEREREVEKIMPPFLSIEGEVTGQFEFSMYNLAQKPTCQHKHGRSKSMCRDGEDCPNLPDGRCSQCGERDRIDSDPRTHTSHHANHHLVHTYASAPTSPQIHSQKTYSEIPFDNETTI